MGERTTAGTRRASEPRWVSYSDEDLLDLRMCDLGLTLEGTALEERVDQLYRELAAKGVRFRPYAWLSSDWFTPDGTTGFAIPFYLAHPRLARLERHQMLEVEGGTHDSCMKILRHETAHAIDNAYRLHWKRRWSGVFGRFSEPYRSSYRPDPASREYVHNLEYWYSQSHPAEDFAETFAVWLDPGSRWRQHYADWPALRKIEFVDELIRSIADEPPELRTRLREEPLSRLRTTLRAHYDRKRAVYSDQASIPELDQHLDTLFSPSGTHAGAVAFLRTNRRRLVQRVSRMTGQHRYLIDHVLREMILRSRTLRLRLVTNERDTLLDAAVLLTSLTMQFLFGGHPHYRR